MKTRTLSIRLAVLKKRRMGVNISYFEKYEFAFDRRMT